MTPTTETLREALKKAKNSFEAIRKTLIKELDEPGRTAFWRSVEGSGACAATLASPSIEGQAGGGREARPLWFADLLDDCISVEICTVNKATNEHTRHYLLDEDRAALANLANGPTLSPHDRGTASPCELREITNVSTDWAWACDKCDRMWIYKPAQCQSLGTLDFASSLATLPVADRAADGWQSIETAPKDGTRVDLYVYWPSSRERSTIRDCLWTGSHWEHSHLEIAATPTHWCRINSILPPDAASVSRADGGAK